MLSFDSKGNLKPYGVISSSLEEAQDFFVHSFTSETRRTNFEKYIKYSFDLKKLIGQPLKQWINGSFVTHKLNPKDIDIVTFIDSDLIKLHIAEIEDFRAGKSWSIYGVDAYIIEVHPAKSALHKFTEYDLLEWLNLFSTTRVNRKGEKFKKGFLEIIY